MLFRSYASVQSSLSAGEGLGQVTAAALTGISNLIGDVKAKFANLADGSLTTDQRTVYQNDVNQLIGQITNYVNQATYNGKNLLSASTTGTAVRSEERRVGKDGVSPGRVRWPPYHKKKKKQR